MKKILFATALFIGISTALFAQQDLAKSEKKTPEQRAEHSTAALTKKLTLTEEQKAKIYAINLEHAKKFESLKDDKQAKAKKSEVRQEAKKNDAQILAVLTDSQKKAYEEMKAKHHSKGSHHKGKKAQDSSAKA